MCSMSSSVIPAAWSIARVRSMFARSSGVSVGLGGWEGWTAAVTMGGVYRVGGHEGTGPLDGCAEGLVVHKYLPVHTDGLLSFAPWGNTS